MQIFRVKKPSCKILKTKTVFHLRCNTTVVGYQYRIIFYNSFRYTSFYFFSVLLLNTIMKDYQKTSTHIKDILVLIIQAMNKMKLKESRSKHLSIV